MIIFDIDDTLYLERDYVRSGFRAVGKHLAHAHGVEGFSDHAWAAFERGVRGNTFNLVLDELGVSPERDLVMELVAVYREHGPDIELLPDARAALDEAKRRGPVGALTDGPRASQRAKAEALGLSAWADHIVFTAELGPDRGKPHPAGFEELERALGGRGSACVYLADNPKKDFVGPKSLGWRTVRVRRPMSLHEDVPSGDDVDVEVRDLNRVLEVLDRLD